MVMANYETSNSRPSLMAEQCNCSTSVGIKDPTALCLPPTANGSLHKKGLANTTISLQNIKNDTDESLHILRKRVQTSIAKIKQYPTSSDTLQTSSNKLRRIESKGISAYKLVSTDDCIAHRTRSKTHLFEEYSVKLDNVSTKPKSPKIEIPRDVCPDIGPYENQDNDNNLTLCRKIRNIRSKYCKWDHENTSNSSKIPKSEQTLQNINIISSNKSKTMRNVTFDSKICRRSSRYCKYKTPFSTKSKKTHTHCRKFSNISSRKNQQMKCATFIKKIEESADKSKEDIYTPNKSTKSTKNAIGMPYVESESDDSDVGRLQSLLEKRGLSPNYFETLGPRMTHILNQTKESTNSLKAQQLLNGIQSNDESQQLQAVIEMCQMLVMGNEDTLSGFPIKQVVPSLIILLRMESNFDIMNNACRALTYMLEALPRSSGVVAEAVPLFLEKLQLIQCMDVAEQSLFTLEILSRRHNKVILQAGGIAACLKFLDFFSINAQRSALAITANCCLNLQTEEFHFISGLMPILTQLLLQRDKKCVDSVCTAFSRLVENFQCDSPRLIKIASKELLKNFQLLLLMSPSVLNTVTFTNLIRMLSLFCSACPNLAIDLLKNDIASTILYLLTGSRQPINSNKVELVARSPTELYEIISLIGDLLPSLPEDKLFAGVPPKPNTEDNEIPRRDEVSINFDISNSYMRKIPHVMNKTHHDQSKNKDNGTTPVPSSAALFPGQNLATADFGETIYCSAILNGGATVQEDGETFCTVFTESPLALNFIKTLFNVLYEVYSSTAGPNIRYKCLRALLRMIYFGTPDILKEILRTQLVSSHIAGMLSSNDMRIVASALQISEILMQKLPSIFGTHFVREGVFYQINKLVGSKSAASYDSFSLNCANADNKNESVLSVNHFPIETKRLTPSTSKAYGFRKTISQNCSSPKVFTQGNIPGTGNSIANTYLHEHLHDRLTISPSSNQHFLVNTPQISYSLYSTNPLQDYGNQAMKRHFQLQLNKNTPKALAFPNNIDAIIHEQHFSTLSNMSSAIKCKVPDILKRNTPAKRRLQLSSFKRSDGDDDLLSRSTEESSSSSISVQQAEGSQSHLSENSTNCSTSLISSLKPTRWRHHGFEESGFSKDSKIATCISMCRSKRTKQSSILNHENTRQWIHEKSISFLRSYTSTKVGQSISTMLKRLSAVKFNLEGNYKKIQEAMREFKIIIEQNDISPFEMNQSGVISSLLNFMTVENHSVSQNQRLRVFMHEFAGLPLESSFKNYTFSKSESSALIALVSKLNACVTQLEQFPIKVQDYTSGSGSLSNIGVLKFFNTHQLKCNLQRHPDCKKLRQWKGGTVKIDPLAMVHAIEKYLLTRGFAGLQGVSEDDSEEDNDVNMEGTRISTLTHKLEFLIGDCILPYSMTVYQAIRQYSSLITDSSDAETESDTFFENSNIWTMQHTIFYRPLDEKLTRKVNKTSEPFVSNKHKDLWLGGNAPQSISPLQSFLLAKLPVEIVTVQDSSLDVICLLRIIHALNRYWGSIYDIVHQKTIIDENEFLHPKLTAKANRQLQDPLVIMTGNLPQWLQQIPIACPFLFPFETRHHLFYTLTFDRDRALQRFLDRTADLSILENSERLGPRLDRRKRTIFRKNILKQAEELINELSNSKALLEIQYENEVGTGLGPTLEFYTIVSAELRRSDLGLWNSNNTFETKLNEEDNSSSLTSVIDTTFEDKVITNSKRVTSTYRNKSFKIDDDSNFKGLKQEISDVQCETPRLHLKDLNRKEEIPYHVDSIGGLFPSPLGKYSKPYNVSKIKSKFKFLGKLMAKALMDGRMLDLPFSKPFYRWLLGEEQTFGLTDLEYVAPEVQKTLIRLKDIVKKKEMIEQDPYLDSLEKSEKIMLLDFDGCPIGDLGLDFVLPGYGYVELCRGGQDVPVTIHNLHKYIALVPHWFLIEGVRKQFAALREGFNSVFSSNCLKIFYAEELENVFCGSDSRKYQPWNLKMLQEYCRTDHGFTQDSEAIHFLFEILSSYNSEEQRLFLQFVTGSPRLPTGGFKSLTPPLTIVRKTFDGDQNPNDYLPSVMTCVNYLKLPEYSNLEVMRTKLKIASTDGSMSFHLS